MSKLADTRICPDCRAPLDTAATCTGCGLRLTGQAAADLLSVMQRADALIEQIRLDGTSERGGTQAAATPPTAGVQVLGGPVAEFPRTGSRTGSGHRLPALTVPVVLLGLGALCVLVAAIVFTVVAWGSLGLGAKAAILLGVSSLFALAARTVTRRGLRGAAEALWLIVAALISVDIAAAYGADLAGLGDVDGRHVAGFTGLAVIALAVGVGSWVPRTPVVRLHGLVGAAGLGTLVLTIAEAFNAEDPAVATTVALPVLTAASVVVAGRGAGQLRRSGIAMGCSAALAWLALIMIGLDRAAVSGASRWWHDLYGWPLLVAATYATTAAFVPRLSGAVRTVGATASLVAFALFVLGGTGGPTSSLLACSGVAVALALVSATTGPIWSTPAGAMTGISLAGATAFVVVRPWDVIARLPASAPAHRANLSLQLPSGTTELEPWTAVVVAVAAAIAGAGLLRHAPEKDRHEATAAWAAATSAFLAVGVATVALEAEPTLVLAVLTWGAVLAVVGITGVLVRRHRVALVVTLALGASQAVLGFRLAVPSHVLAAALATVLALGLAAAFARAATQGLRGWLLPILGAGGLLSAGFAAAHWPWVAGASQDAAGVSLAVLAAVSGVAAARVGRRENARRSLEAMALLLGLTATFLPTDTAVAATALTITGSGAALVSVLNKDRDLVGWLAVVLLLIATVVRLAAEVEAPELYTVPAAVLLLAGGVHRLRSDAGASTYATLTRGLTLGLVPSLLLALDDPVSLRGALIAVAAAAVLAVGVRLRWAAPFVAGAIGVAVLAVRHLGPVADAVPRWASLGSVGIALLLVGITWEARRRNLETAERYLTALR